MSAQPTNKPIFRKRGDTASFIIQITSDGVKGIDITGFTFLLTVDPSAHPSGTGNNLFQLSIGSGLALSTPTDGEITVTLSTAQAGIAIDSYFYDVRQTDGAGALRIVLEGRWIVDGPITQ